MWSALFKFLLQFVLQSCVLADATYECGDHGRFEYCIDEIPGCVIGCHCHPGYYFDTITKICESNIKLIEHHRRNNVVKTDRVQENDVTPRTLYDTVPNSSTNRIDESVDEIAKEANDLGDWLYNQFFKTIENQVINNTNNKDILTRRSASQHIPETPKKNKKWRKGGKSLKQKEKKEQLRRKLLRITENDSLFDISSKSSSDSSDSSSSGDLSSIEYEIDESNRQKHDDDEHGHKKIVMINKKPKQPLPSFIFLPNLNTPFYPPIGLPAPPIVPMYPMVPVPPVPLCPITGCIDSPDSNGASTSVTSITSSVTPSSTGSVTTTTSVTTIPTSSSITSSAPKSTEDLATADPTKTSDVTETDTRALRLKKKKKKKAAKLLNNNRDDIRQKLNNLNYFERQELLQRFKENMGNPAPSLLTPPWKKNKKYKDMNQNGDAEDSFLDNSIVDNEFSNIKKDQNQIQEDVSLPDSVDFKYISELIHHVNLNNKSNNLSPIEYNPLNNVGMYRSPKIYNGQSSEYSVPFDITSNRRINRPMQHKSDESYYANLGRQIATLIRGADTNQKDVLEDTQNKIKNDPFLKNNSPTSFWERSVRSPFTYLKAKNKKFEYLKRSNELLFDIENKVEIIASTTPSLTLQEIENVVKVMQIAKKEIQINNRPIMIKPEVSYQNLNIDLWPHNSSDSRNTVQPSVLSFLNKMRQGENTNIYKTKTMNMKPNNNPPIMHMHNFQIFEAKNVHNSNRDIQLTNNTHFIPLTGKPLINNKHYKTAQTNYNLEIPKKIHRVLEQNVINQSYLNQNINPYHLHHRKYFQDNDNTYYANPNAEFPQYPPVVKISGVQQSYYFPEKNHFDYIY